MRPAKEGGLGVGSLLAGDKTYRHLGILQYPLNYLVLATTLNIVTLL